MKTNILTGFRFFAAFIVVNYHYGNITGPPSVARGFLSSGPEMVTFFFVLSGFVMAVAYLKRKNFSVSDYWMARIARIAPVYYLAFVLGIFVFYSASDYKNNIIGVILNAVLLQSWVPPYPLSINGPGWSLSVEAFFYICFPAILIFLKKSKPNVLILMITAVALYLLSQLVLINLYNSPICVQFPSVGHDLVYFFPLSHFPSFYLGVAGGYLAMETEFHSSIKSNIFWSFGCLTWIIVIVCLLNNRGIINQIGGFDVALGTNFLAPIFLILILFSVSKNNALVWVFSSRPLIILGEASYGLYILQKPLHKLFSTYISPALSLNKTVEFYTFTVLLVIVSVAVYYLLELPSKRAIIRTWKGFKTSPLGMRFSLGNSPIESSVAASPRR